ncbi:MAG: short-chain dehydrogenase [Coxiella sp. (in: Bacteria)]|nr:MAG: short-chain dehydrogenase [Coxiella sp. (in: g-proteobacteria)]
MSQLQDKVVLITGSTQGIGAASARACVEAGAKVMLHGRNEERAKELCAELGKNTAYCIKSLTDADTAPYIMGEVLKKFGRLDVLVNNAGIFPRNDISSLGDENYDQIMTVNLRTPLFLCKEAVEVFRTQPTKGCIVNIGSINAHVGQSDLLIYSISKGGLMTMTRNLGDSLAKEGIRVNQLNVGWTVTDTEHALKMSEGLPEHWESLVPKMFAPTGKLMHPEDIAKHVVFWASDSSAPVTGQVYSCEQYPAEGRNIIPEVQSYINK